MERNQRRLRPTARTYQHTRVPAYKVRRRPHEDDGGRNVEPNAETLSNGVADAADVVSIESSPTAATDMPVAQDTSVPESEATPDVSDVSEGFDTAIMHVVGGETSNAQLASGGDAHESAFAEYVDAIDPDGENGHASALIAPEANAVHADTDSDVAPEASASDVPGVVDATNVVRASDDDEIDYAAYLQSVEAAAARSRAELSATRPRLRPGAVAGVQPAAPVRARHAAQAAPGEGGKGGPPRNAARRRNGKQPDPRPFFRRPKTWIVILAMIPVIAGIVAAIYFGSLFKTALDAYNDSHVDQDPRPVFTVNEQGTPVVVPTDQVQAQLPDWGDKDPFNILLLGIDERPNDEDPPRSDTAIVVHVDPEAETVKMMSIPRDLLVTIPGFGDERINAAYTFGEENREDVPGCEDEDDPCGPVLVMQTIEANFGIPIHYWATVDFNGFREVVDTIGGIVIDVPAPIKDDLYPTESLGVTRIYFHTGLQKMDGETALRYARTRHGDNDIMRGERQQQVLQAIRSQAISLDLITRAGDLMREAGDAVKTSLDFNQMLALANLGRKIDRANITQVNLWEEEAIFENDWETTGEAFYFLGDWPVIWEIVQANFGVDLPDSLAADDSPPVTPSPSATANSDATETAEAELEETIAAEEDIETSTSTSTATAEPTPAPGPGLNYALPVVVENGTGVEGMATAGMEQLLAEGFTEVYADAADELLDTTVIYDNAGSPDTCAWIAQVLGLPNAEILPGFGGTAIVVVLGADALGVVE